MLSECEMRLECHRSVPGCGEFVDVVAVLGFSACTLHSIVCISLWGQSSSLHLSRRSNAKLFKIWHVFEMLFWPATLVSQVSYIYYCYYLMNYKLCWLKKNSIRGITSFVQIGTGISCYQCNNERYQLTDLLSPSLHI